MRSSSTGGSFFCCCKILWLAIYLIYLAALYEMRKTRFKRWVFNWNLFFTGPSIRFPWGFSSDYKRFIEELNSLLDKVMLRNQWHIRVHQHHLMFKGHRWAPHKTIYGYQKKVCLDKTFPLGHFMLHFIIFLICQWLQKLVMFLMMRYLQNLDLTRLNRLSSVNCNCLKLSSSSRCSFEVRRKGHQESWNAWGHLQGPSFYRPPAKLGEGNVFTGVCFFKRGGLHVTITHDAMDLTI